MRNFKRKILLMMASALVLIKPAKADIEAIAIVPEKLSNAHEHVVQYMDNITAVQKAIDDAVQAAKGGLNQVTGVINTVTNPQIIVDQVVGGVKTTVMSGVSGFVDGTKTDDEGKEAVQETYVPSYNESDIKRRRGFDEKNKNSIHGVARLFGRTIVLREELRKETSPNVADISFGTIDDAQRASNALLIKSSERWNKMLEINANINGFKSAVDIQNFRRDEEKGEKSNEKSE